MSRFSSKQYFFYIVVCFDAKINFDDNAQFRQKEVFAMDDMSENDPREVEAAKHNLNYIGMDGNIACLGKSFEQISDNTFICNTLSYIVSSTRTDSFL